jgi:TRAP-type C4-dicarboxylate transport system substrate-binding protein
MIQETQMHKLFVPPLLAATALFSSLSAQAQVVLTASTWVPPTHLLSRAQAEWCDDVGKATEGRVRCNILPKPAAPPPATFDAVRDGIVDLSFGVHNYTPGRFVLTEVAEMPFLGESATASSIAYQHIYDKHLAALNEHRGLKVLAVFTHGPGRIFSAKVPVKTLADLQGMKFRTSGGVQVRICEVLKTNCTLKPAPEAYELLSSGVVDGTFWPDESVTAFRTEKLIRHATRIPGGLYNVSFAFVMNPATWQKIARADQAAIEKLSGEHAARRFGQFWDAEDVKARTLHQQAGIQVHAADPKFLGELRAALGQIEQQWADKAKEKGLANPQQVLGEMRSEIAKVK